MIRISLSEIHDMARATVLANTPMSLYREVAKLHSVERISREASTNEIVACLEAILSRKRRNEITAGLQYALFVALLLSGRSSDVDASKMKWGSDLQAIAQRTMVTSSRSVIASDQPAPTFQVNNVTGGGNIILATK